MAIRITCPSCDAANNIDDDKRGRKVRCRKCDEPISVPAEDDAAVQDGRKVKLKAGGSRTKGEDDDRPSKKKKGNPAKKGFPIMWVLGGAAALFFVLLLGVGALAAFFLWPQKTKAVPQETIKAEVKKEPEVIKDPEPIIKEPVKELKKEPEPKKAPTLSPELQRVKDATVMVSALVAGGKRIEGSGFFTVESGLVITNTHVLGMLDAGTDPPRKIEVTLNPGEPTETKATGEFLGVDRANDLAALRVNVPNLPALLPFEDAASIAETQKVHIAGFPSGKKARKDITFKASEITKLKKDGDGMLEQVQLDGGMSFGNSGGPVVTTTGKVVGVAMGALKGTNVHLAIPTITVQRFLDGRIGDTTLGKTFLKNGQTKVPAQYELIDPLKRISELRVEVWMGKPGLPRPYAYKLPAPLNGDSARKPQPLANQKSKASNDVVLPTPLPTGQVYWLQPVIVGKDNMTQWGIATSVAPLASPYDLKPADLTVNLQSPKERTVTLTSTFTQKNSSVKTEATLLESLRPDPDGAQMRTAYGTLTITTDAGGAKTTASKQILDLMRQIPTTYVIDNTNLIKKRTYRQLGKDVKDQRDQVLDEQFRLSSELEAAQMLMPNRTVQPSETWASTVFVQMRSNQKSASVQLELTSTYEGILKKDGRSEAVITVVGRLKANNKDFKKFEGPVKGKIGFDTAGAFISSAQLKVGIDPDNAGDKDFGAFDIDLQRVAGNGTNIKFPQDPKTPDPVVAKSKVVLDKKDKLAASDPTDAALTQAKKKAHYKEYIVPMDMGKTYVIEVKNAAFAPLVKLVGPNGAMVAQNAGAGGARISSRAAAPGAYHVFVVGSNHKTGAFHLTVTENP